MATPLPEGTGSLPPDPVALSLCTIAPDGTTTGHAPVTSGAPSVVAAINDGPEFVEGETPCKKVADTNIYIWTFVYERAGKFQLEHAVGYPHQCNNIIINRTARLGASDALSAYQKLG